MRLFCLRNTQKAMKSRAGYGQGPSLDLSAATSSLYVSL